MEVNNAKTNNSVSFNAALDILHCSLIVLTIADGGVQGIMNAYLRFSEYPLEIYPKYIQLLLITLLPMVIIIYYPTQALLDRIDFMVVYCFIGVIVFFEKGATFIITSHDVDDIEDLCSRVCIINKGQKVFDESLYLLKSFYDDKRIVTILLSEEVNPSCLKSFNVMRHEKSRVDIEIDLTKSTLKDEVHILLDLLPLYDISINNINIEEVIKQIYEN